MMTTTVTSRRKTKTKTKMCRPNVDETKEEHDEHT